MRLADTRAIVSGGVSGLGLAAAFRIVSAGGQVVLLDIDEAAATAALAALGAGASFLATDVTHEGDVEAAIEQARARMGAINAAINCAGIGASARLVGKQGAMPAPAFRRTARTGTRSGTSVQSPASRPATR